MRRNSRLLSVTLLFFSLAVLPPSMTAQDIPEGSAEAVSEFAQGMSL
jgi:hypothetical protein